MAHYAGIGVSLGTSSICIVDGSGTVPRELKAESEPEALATALTATGFALARIGLKAGPVSQWLHSRLRAAGLPVVLLETRQLRAATRPMPVKTDRTDARAIARMVRTGWFRAVHVKSELSQELRALLTARKLLVGKLRDIDNGIRGLLRGFGLKVGAIAHQNKPLVLAQDLGHGHREALRHAPRQGRRRPQARRRAAQHVARRRRVPLGQGGDHGVVAATIGTSVRRPVAGTRQGEAATGPVPASAEPARWIGPPRCLAAACGGSTPTTNRSEAPAT